MNYNNMQISPTAKIARNATVLGDVILGDDVTVLFHAVVRGDVGGKVIVGNRTNIQEHVCLHVPLNGDTVVGNDVTIGHGAIVHGCTIEDGTLIGMGSIILDGAHVGKNCLVGAGAVVTGTADIPDGMLVLGAPARAVRPLSPEEIDSLSLNVTEYLKISRDMVDQGIITEGFAANEGC